MAEVQQLGWQQTSPPGSVPAIERVSVANNDTQADNASGLASFSADGRYAAFESFASNLVPGDTNGTPDIFIYDRQTDLIERVSLADDGTQGDRNSRVPDISDDGRYVAFESSASNLVPAKARGEGAGKTVGGVASASPSAASAS